MGGSGGLAAPSMLLLALSAHAAVCSWLAPQWNDGELSFRHPEAKTELVWINAGWARVDEAGKVKPGNLNAPAVKLTLLEDGALWVVAKDESVEALGVVTMPVAALHPSEALMFGTVFRARGQDTVTLRSGEAGKVVIEPQLPPWFHAAGHLVRSVPCAAVELSIRQEAVEPFQKMPELGSLSPNTDIALTAGPGGPPAATIRCKGMDESSESVSGEDYEASLQNTCPWVSVVERRTDLTKVRIEVDEGVIEGWVASEAVGPAVGGSVYGIGGLGTHGDRYRCGPEKLYVLAEGQAFAVAQLAPDVVVKRLRIKDDGWAEVRVVDAGWLEGQLIMDPVDFRRCVLISE